jgi:hypothetical protein
VPNGQLKVLKNRRQPRTIALLAPLRQDLVEWAPRVAAVVASCAGVPCGVRSFWRATDWRNWRKRIYMPVAESVGLAGARRPTCATRSRRCACTKDGCRSSKSPLGPGTTRPSASTPTRT